jgi:hypothetical protein
MSRQRTALSPCSPRSSLLSLCSALQQRRRQRIDDHTDHGGRRSARSPRPASRRPLRGQQGGRPDHLPLRLRLLGVGLDRRGHRGQQKGYFEKMCLDVDLKASFSTANYPLVADKRGTVRQRRAPTPRSPTTTRPTTPGLVVVAIDGKTAIDSLIVKEGEGRS